MGAAAYACLVACAPSLGPEPKLAQPAAFASDRSLDAPPVDWPTDAWWRLYPDPQLDALIQEALKGSPDLKTAAARVRAAESAAEQAGSKRLPSASAKASVDEAFITQSLGLPPAFASAFPPEALLTQGSANLTYELDFFGKNRASLAAAISEAQAARADQAQARLELTTSVASAYLDFIRLCRLRDEAVSAVKIRRDTLALIADRRRNGLETRADFSLQNATVAVAQGEIDLYDQQIVQARHALAALLGEGPDRGLSVTAPSLSENFVHPYGLPAHLALDLVGRRPDIVAARLRAEALRRRIAVAKADFYPNIDLTAGVTAILLGQSNPTEHAVTLTQFGPAVTLPLFSGGQLEGAYRGSRAAYDEAVAVYDKTLANALKDVADAVAGERSMSVQLADAKSALASDEDAYAIAKLRYQGGLSPYLNVLTAESAVLQQREVVINLTVQSLGYDLALVRALGGGYIEPGAASSRRTR